jgi:hypothetical protein
MPPGAGSKGDSGQPVLPAVHRLGSRQERKGQGEPPATWLVLFAAARLNTGAVVREVQARGQEAREPPTTRQRPDEESEGA